jgi:hypothetical protein
MQLWNADKFMVHVLQPYWTRSSNHKIQKVFLPTLLLDRFFKKKKMCIKFVSGFNNCDVRSDYFYPLSTNFKFL